MSTIRVGQRERFTTIDRGTLNDDRLSFRARGILVWLLDKPDDWTTTADRIACAGIEGRDAVRAGLRELETCGYLVRRKWRSVDNGQWNSEWTVLERPEGTKPGRVSSDGKPATVFQASLQKTEQNTELAEVFHKLADKDCFQCHGSGISYTPGGGLEARDARCACTKPLTDLAETVEGQGTASKEKVKAVPPWVRAGLSYADWRAKG